MLNGSLLNGSTLNGSAGRFLQQQVSADNAYTWSLRVIVGGVDRTADLTGAVEIDREEGAAGIAQLALYLPESPIVPTSWIGRSVTIDYLSQSASGSADVRRFSGQIVEPVWDPLTRVMSCQCSDNLQQRIEALSVDEVDALVGGHWSADLFDPADGRSRWDYAQERLESRPASLDCSPAGALRVTSWYAQPASYVFGAGTTLYQSVRIDMPLLGDMTNVVEIECSYRYPRLIQRNHTFFWSHPLTGGVGGEAGYCTFLHDSGDLLTIDMVREATASAGLTLVSGAYNLVPPTGIYCDPPIPTVNADYGNLILSGNWTGAERWTQQVTEHYVLRVVVEPSIAQAGEIIERVSASVSVESSRADEWGFDGAGAADGIGGGGDAVAGVEDVSEPIRRAALLESVLHQALTRTVAAHRDTLVSWSAPTSMVMAADLVHTLTLEDQGVRATGKCRRVLDEFDLEAGSAITTLTIAVMRGGAGTGDPLDPPTVPAATLPPSGSVTRSTTLPTQLGGRGDAPYDDDRIGFAGNYDNANPAYEQYPRRLDVSSDEVPAIDRDEHVIEVAAIYRLSIPNDLLELT